MYLSVSGYEILIFQIHVIKLKKTSPNVTGVSLSTDVASFMVTSCANSFVFQSQISLGFLPSWAMMCCGVALANAEKNTMKSLNVMTCSFQSPLFIVLSTKSRYISMDGLFPLARKASLFLAGSSQLKYAGQLHWCCGQDWYICWYPRSKVQGDCPMLIINSRWD